MIIYLQKALENFLHINGGNMNLFELIPSEENIYNTYIEDLIDRSGEVVKFAEILDAIPSNCSIAIDSYWGSGKTFFVKQVKMLLDIYNEFIEDNYSIDKNEFKLYTNRFFNRGFQFNLKPQIAIYYDAWENDDEDPVQSLLYEICKTPISDPDFLKSNDLIEIFKSIISLLGKKDYMELLDSLKSHDVLSDIKASKNLKELINDFFESLLPEQGERLVIFIDELDRCKPSFAVDLLEKIKHYFCNDKITFVFSINATELQHTIKQFYGENFDGYKYLSKMFDMYIMLPKPNLEKYYSYTGNSMITGNPTTDFIIRAVIEAYHFELREIKKYILMFQIATKKLNLNNAFYHLNDGFNFSVVFILPIMMGLKIHNIDLYNKFISGNNSAPLVSILGQAYKEGINFEKLLLPDETYHKTDFTEIYVTIDDKIEQVYHSLFKYNDYNSGKNYYVGDVKFNKDNVKQLLKLMSMLSDYFEFPNETEN